MDQRQLVKDLINSQTHMVISTCGGDKPEAALVGFAADEDLNIVFGTDSTTRKAQNLNQNPKVAIVIRKTEPMEVQYEGVATLLSGEEQAKYEDIYFHKNPGAKKYQTAPNQVYYKVTPTWARYVDFITNTIFEIEL